MNKLITTPLLALIIGVSGCASASPRWAHEHHEWENRHQFEDVARVINVKPIYDTVQVSVPEQRCWRERVLRSSYHRDSYTTPLVGAIIGGVVGNQFGRGSGKTAMTVAGTLLGASIGNDLDHSRYDDDDDYRPVHRRRCETVNNYESREEIVGYRVKYRYKGRIYRTRMDHDPGDTLRVRVTVRPID
jgi:uncharacterized protein YcfJ